MIFKMQRVFLLLVLLVTYICASDLKLSEQESLFVQNHPVVRVSNIRDWVPYDYNSNSQAKGYAVDYLKILAKKIGIKLEFVTDDWAVLEQKTKNKDIDVIHSISKNLQREEYLTFTQPFLQMRYVLVTQENSSYKNLNDLTNKKLSLVKGWSSTKYIKKNYPNIKVIERDDSNKILEDVAFGHSDACLDDFVTANYISTQKLYNNLKIASNIESLYKFEDLHIAVRKDWFILKELFNKAIENMSEKELMALNEKWMIENKSKKIVFTKEEKEFIKNNKIIKVGGEMDYPPFEYLEDGQYKGIAKDYLDALEKKLDVKFEMQTGYNWDELLNMLKDNKLDLLPMISHTQDRQKYLNFTKTFLQSRYYLYTKKENKSFNSIDDLDGKTIAIPKSHAQMEIIKRKYPNVKIYETVDSLSAMQAVIKSKADAFFENQLIANYLLSRHNIDNIKPVFALKIKEIAHFCMASSKNNVILRNIIQKGLDSLTFDEKQKINKKWRKVSKIIDLNNKEVEFIQNNKIKCVTTTTWAPFNTVENDKMVGIAFDYWKVINEELGLNSECKVLKTWNDVLDAIKTKQADITLGTSITKDRKEYANFSKPYASFPIAIATRNDKGYIPKTSLLKGKTIAVGKNYTAHLLIKKHYPDFKLVPVKNINEALKLVAKGEVYAAIGVLPVLTYNISKLGYFNLKISGVTEYNFDIRIMIRKDYKELLSIVNKGIDAISEDKRHAIQNKWISVKFEKGFDYSLFWKIIIPFIVIGFFILLRNMQLLKHQKEIKLKNIELEHAKKELILNKVKLEKLASEDSLTALYNRRKFDELLEVEWKNAIRNKTTIAFGMVDIDYFKLYNDTYGHKEGDKALIAVASQIKKSLHRPRDIVARYGGEEFILLVSDIDEKGFRHLLETICANVLELKIPHKSSIVNEYLSVSIGGIIGYIDKDSDNLEYFINADKLLYEAKEKGRNRVEVKSMDILLDKK